MKAVLGCEYSYDVTPLLVGGANCVAPNNPSVLKCASDFADRTSIAGGLHALGIGNNGGVGGFLTNALGGNAVSGLVNLFTGQGSTADVAFGGTRGGLPGAGEGPAGRLSNGIAGVVQDSIAIGANGILNAGGEITTLAGTATTAGLTGAEYATGVGWIKFGYDAASYAAGLAGCAAGLIN
ncbi:hypothetical protein [Acidipila rosea]|uniref:Uncharacterized protein n=1 Tax=Acidipila rosea TaxID=768535 RepID=A0A4R1LEM8_9BACT|nr:hypothetical protein [Acidipila rosea]TCK75099.1 hypothetical protein C7378_0079 [Acidipila rosea]